MGFSQSTSSPAIDPDDNPRAVPAARGLTVFYQNRFLYSSEDPEGRADRNARTASPTASTLVVVPSPLLGYGLLTLVDRLEPGSHILCIEVDQKLMALSLERIPENILHHERISFIRTEDPSRAVEYLRLKGLLHCRKTLFLPLSAGYSLHPDAYRAIHQAIDGEIRRYWQNRMTLIHMGRLWTKNIFTNLPHLADARDLGSVKTRKPVVVAGAGESIEGSVSWMLEARESFFLLAADTALPALLAYGLRPDMVLALEAQHHNLKDFIGSDGTEFALACDLTSYPGVIRRFPGRTWFFSSAFAEIRLLGRLEAEGLLPVSIPPLGSVGITALYTALGLTSKAVFITGLDFAYARGKPHARHAPTHTMYLSKTSRLSPSPLFTVSDIRPLEKTAGKTEGSIVRTDRVLSSYAADARELITGSAGRVFDTSRIGMPLGAVPLDGRDAVLGKLREAGAVTDTPHSPDAADSGALRDRVRTFLENEKFLLESFLEAAAGEAAGEAVEWRLSPGLRDRLLELDYLYLDFPDQPPLPADNPGFLARTVLSGRYYLERIERSLGRLSGQGGTPG